MYYQSENYGGQFVYRSRFHNTWTAKENIHDYSECLYCKSGEGYAEINKKIIHIKQDQFIWIPPNYVHRFVFPNADVTCAVFSNDFVPLFFKEQKGRALNVIALNADEISPILNNLHLLSSDEPCVICAHLNLILNKVIKNSSFEDLSKRDGDLCRKIFSYISEHYTDDISLSQIAKTFGYNEKYLSHALHQLTGIHFRQFIAQHRINYAKMLLQNEHNADITTIAMKCGFSSTNTFYRAFKNATEMTPLEYRKSK